MRWSVRVARIFNARCVWVRVGFGDSSCAAHCLGVISLGVLANGDLYGCDGRVDLLLPGDACWSID